LGDEIADAHEQATFNTNRPEDANAVAGTGGPGIAIYKMR
jgi:hypothetical protein